MVGRRGGSIKPDSDSEWLALHKGASRQKRWSKIDLSATSNMVYNSQLVDGNVTQRFMLRLDTDLIPQGHKSEVFSTLSPLR